DDAKQRYADAEVRDGRAPGGARQPHGATKGGGERHAEEAGALGDVGYGAGHDKEGEPDHERREDRPAAGERKSRRHGDDRQGKSDKEALGHAVEVTSLPCEQRPERNGDKQRHRQPAYGRVEERRADGNLVARQSFERERIERADKDGGADSGEKQVVE